MPTYINGKPIGSTGETVDIDTSNFSNLRGDNSQEVFSEIDNNITATDESIGTIDESISTINENIDTIEEDIDTLQDYITWASLKNNIGTISGTADLIINANLGSSQKVLINAESIVTWQYQNLDGFKSSVVLKIVNGGSATSHSYGVLTQFASGTAPTLQLSGTDHLIIWKDIDDTMHIDVISSDSKIIS